MQNLSYLFPNMTVGHRCPFWPSPFCFKDAWKRLFCNNLYLNREAISLNSNETGNLYKGSHFAHLENFNIFKTRLFLHYWKENWISKLFTVGIFNARIGSKVITNKRLWKLVKYNLEILINNASRSVALFDNLRVINLVDSIMQILAMIMHCFISEDNFPKFFTLWLTQNICSFISDYDQNMLAMQGHRTFCNIKGEIFLVCFSLEAFFITGKDSPPPRGH